MAKKAKQNISTKRILSKGVTVFFWVLMLLIALSLYIPIIWLMMNSFKGDLEFHNTPAYAFTKAANWSNYTYILNEFKYVVTTSEGRITYGLWNMALNSVLYALLISLYGPFMNLICAYVISKYKFKSRNFIYNMGIVLMIVPIIGAGGSALIFKKTLGIYDNMILQILTSPSMAFSGLNFLIFYAAFKSVPWAYAEAAFVDGAGHFRIFFQIMLPMVIPTYAVLFLLGFVGAWNDFETFLFFLPSYANLALGMYNLQQFASLEGATTPQVLAGFVIIAIPTVALYLLSQRLIASKFTVGGLKG